ncbi:MAG: hypothetical protein H0T89_34325 [Deltaproteobacteria bacterium]|nr:hypothetical protein [Deltaproteobacteria bacterium]MDQ3297956.1 hypothetical protein [Myxococcota bacterium]
MKALLLVIAIAGCSKAKQSESEQQIAPPNPVVVPGADAAEEPGPEPSSKAAARDDKPLAKHDDKPSKATEKRDDKAVAKHDDKPARAPGDEIPPSLFEPPPPVATEPTPPPPAIDHGGKPPMPDKAPDKSPAPPPVATEPLPRTGKPKLVAMANSSLCVTTGTAAIGARVEKAAMRFVAKGSEGDAAAMTFTFQGETATVKKLASGQDRRQLGLKLRAENGCNLIYVMWRLDPKPKLDISVKSNPGAKDHKGCGAGGYTKVKPTKSSPLPTLVVGTRYTLRAEIVDDELTVTVDDKLAWKGTLPESARALRGPAGIRSDNLAFDLESFSAPSASVALGNAKCVAEDGD